MKLMKDIWARNLTMKFGKDYLLEDIYLIYNTYTEIEKKEQASANLLHHLTGKMV